jgi:hypothetical protein
VHLGRWRRLDHDTLSLLAGAARVYSTRCRERGRQIFEQRVEYPLPKETGVEGFISIETADAENLFWGRRSAVWNNNGDKAVLRDENGADVARYAYRDLGSTPELLADGLRERTS